MESIPGQNVVNKVIDYLAHTSTGQFFIKKIIFWSIEQVSKYSVQEENKVEDNTFLQINTERRLPWLVFWTLLINLHIFRVVISKILVNFNKKPIESKNIVKNIQKWRRLLRSIRSKGLRKIREQESGIKAENGETTKESDISITNSNKKRPYEDDELYDQLMNQSYSETDDFDSTFAPDISVTSSSSSSNEESYESPLKYNSNINYQENVPDTQSTESAKFNDKSTDETVDLPMINEAAKSEVTINGNGSNSSNLINGKESLNKFIYPEDALISELVSLSKGPKLT